jgi:hypothetical protein
MTIGPANGGASRSPTPGDKPLKSLDVLLNKEAGEDARAASKPHQYATANCQLTIDNKKGTVVRPPRVADRFSPKIPMESRL